MKILTINLHYSDNYGAVLEAYALQKIIERNSHQTECINFLSFNDESLPGKLFRRMSSFLLNRAERKKYITKILVKLHLKKEDSRITLQQRYSCAIGDLFDVFRKHYLNTTPEVYHTSADLKKSKLSEESDMVICGSDVIWYVGNESVLDVYFLSWVSDDTPKVAYAPSWGMPNIDKLNNGMRKTIAGYLSRFDAVSVREKSGVDICAALGRSDAQWVPDPTVLLTADDWNKIAENKFNGRYIFNYHIPNDWNTSVDGTKILAVVTEHCKAPVKKIPDLEADYVWLSPTEWVGAIRDAEFVVTNSFHGVVFCIIFNKDFLFTKLVGEHASLNERIYSMLELFGLKDRIVSEDIASDDEKIRTIVEFHIDWTDVNQKLSAWRQTGIDYLKKAITNVHKHKKSVD